LKSEQPSKTLREVKWRVRRPLGLDDEIEARGDACHRTDAEALVWRWSASRLSSPHQIARFDSSATSRQLS
jgi:hypothetical protein